MSAQAQIVSFNDAKKAAKVRPSVAAQKKASKKPSAAKASSSANAASAKPVARQAKPSQKAASKSAAAKPSVKKAAAKPVSAKPSGSKPTSTRQASAKAASRPSAKASAKASRATKTPAQKKSVQVTRQKGAQEAQRSGTSAKSAKASQATQAEKKTSTVAKAVRAARKEKAGKAFTKQFGGESSSSESAPSASRAALYKGEMGSTHKKATRMQNSASKDKPGFGIPSLKLGDGALVRILKGLAVVACIAAICAFVYPSAQQYYVTTREYQQLQAEYEAIQERNAVMQREVDSLSTSEGIEDKAREEFGWVKEGENAVNVYGLEGVEDESRYSKGIQPGSIQAPETWYSRFLDPLFGIQ